MSRLIHCVFIFGMFQLCAAQINQTKSPVYYAAKHYQSSSSSFTDSSNYNSYNFTGNPLGRLEIDTNLVELKTGYRLVSSSVNGPLDSAGTYNGFLLPVISLRPNFNTLMSFNYNLNSVKTDSLSLPLHQFGFLMLSQTTNSVIKGGLTGQGFIGTEKQSDGDNTRTLMGIKDVGICLGSKIVPQFTLDVYAHAAFFIDTLYNSDENRMLQERMACVKLPQIDAVAEIILPRDKANISFTYAKQHFVYTQKSDNDNLTNSFHEIAGYNGSEHQWDADAIVNDSMLIALQNIVRLDLNSSIALLPALTLSYMHNSFVRMEPGNDNHPLSYEGEKSGYDWQTGSFRFGIGSTVQLFDISSIWFEFAHSSLNLSLGDEYPDDLIDSKSKGFNRLGIGTRLNFARIPAFNISKSTDLALTLGYLFEQRNDLLSSYNGEAFGHVRPMAVNTQLYRYTPWRQFDETITSSGIQTGLRAAFKDQTFVTDLYFTYANQSITGPEERNGNDIEMGLDLILNVKNHEKN